jgi:hypothetical protein
LVLVLILGSFVVLVYALGYFDFVHSSSLRSPLPLFYWFVVCTLFTFCSDFVGFLPIHSV